VVEVKVRLPAWMIKEIDRLIQERRYKGRSTFIRHAVRELLKREQAYPFTNRGIPK